MPEPTLPQISKNYILIFYYYNRPLQGWTFEEYSFHATSNEQAREKAKDYLKTFGIKEPITKSKIEKYAIALKKVSHTDISINWRTFFEIVSIILAAAWQNIIKIFSEFRLFFIDFKLKII